MQLESLANELLLDLFSYIKSVHLLRAFYGLNSRFNTLLIVHFRSNPLDFRYVSKTDFDIVCQQQLPSLTHHIHSLNLFNDDKTCQQIERFLSHNLTLIQFTNLQSLTLGYINFEIMERLLNHLSSLSHLTYLHLIETFIQFPHIDIIFRLPKLIYCYLYSIANTHSSYQPTARSASIKKFLLHIQCDII